MKILRRPAFHDFQDLKSAVSRTKHEMWQKIRGQSVPEDGGGVKTLILQYRLYKAYQALCIFK